jgi:hypothetical protein
LPKGRMRSICSGVRAGKACVRSTGPAERAGRRSRAAGKATGDAGTESTGEAMIHLQESRVYTAAVANRRGTP